MQKKRRRFIKRRWTGYIQKRKCSRIGQYRKELSIITYGVETIIECNKKIVVDYLNVTFNLMQTMHKPDNKITYINVQSNYPPNIIKQLSKTKEQRLFNNSSNKVIFNEAIRLYRKTLSKADYDSSMQIWGY